MRIFDAFKKFKVQRCSNTTNNVDGAEEQFGSPTMQSSNLDVSRNKSIAM